MFDLFGVHVTVCPFSVEVVAAFKCDDGGLDGMSSADNRCKCLVSKVVINCAVFLIFA